MHGYMRHARKPKETIHYSQSLLQTQYKVRDLCVWSRMLLLFCVCWYGCATAGLIVYIAIAVYICWIAYIARIAHIANATRSAAIVCTARAVHIALRLPSIVAPVRNEPVHNEPVHGEPVHDEPVHHEPVHDEPVHDEPVHHEPVQM